MNENRGFALEAAGKNEIIARQRDNVRKALCDVLDSQRNFPFIVC
jgi:hypothetical protein